MAFDTTTMPPYNASDPAATFLATSCLDFLLIELVPMAYRITQQLDHAAVTAPSPHAQLSLPLRLSTTTTTTTTASVASHDQNKTAPDAAPAVPEKDHLMVVGARQAKKGGAGMAREQSARGEGKDAALGGGAGNVISGAVPMDEDEERDAVCFRLDALGYRVGQGLVERFSRDRPRFVDSLDVIKFVCKDLWMLVFKKQIDNLKTNHRGVYVLTDNSFRPFSRMSTAPGGQAVIRAEPFLWFPCGIIRGALAAMGISATVNAETHELPSAIFQIKTTMAVPP